MATLQGEGGICPILDPPFNDLKGGYISSKNCFSAVPYTKYTILYKILTQDKTKFTKHKYVQHNNSLINKTIVCR